MYSPNVLRAIEQIGGEGEKQETRHKLRWLLQGK